MRGIILDVENRLPDKKTHSRINVLLGSEKTLPSESRQPLGDKWLFLPGMPNRPTINILWFKRDLRLRDHAPLQAAIAMGQRTTRRPLLLLYCFEPSLIADPNYDLRHWRFVHECLADLQQQLAAMSRPPNPQTTVVWCTSGYRLNLRMLTMIVHPKRVHPPFGYFTGR